MNVKECGHCGYIGKPVHDEYSSLVIDAFIWGAFFVVTVITGILPLIFIGPLFTVWHLITFRALRCPKCGHWDMHKLPDKSRPCI